MYVTCEVWPNQSHQPIEDQMEDVDPQPKKGLRKSYVKLNYIYC